MLSRGIFPNQFLHPYVNQIYEIPVKLVALVCLMSFAPKYLVVLSKLKLIAENRVSTSFVVGVVNTESFMGFIKFPFYKQTN